MSTFLKQNVVNESYTLSLTATTQLGDTEEVESLQSAATIRFFHGGRLKLTVLTCYDYACN